MCSYDYLQNDAAQNLSSKSRRLLKRLGVLSVLTLGKREFLAWVGTIGGPTWGEARSLNSEEEMNTMWSSGVTLDVLVPRVLHGERDQGQGGGGEAVLQWTVTVCKLQH